MAQYINKSDLVAEIEKRECKLNIDSPHGIGAMVELECLKDIINTLEVKAKELVMDNDGEYTRTNDFIEKACKWLEKNAGKYTWYDEYDCKSGMIYGFIDAFKNHMKEK